MAGQSLDRERLSLQHTSEPGDLLDAVDGAGTGVFERPGEQVAAVMLAPGLARGPVALEIVGVDVVVELA